VKKFFVTLILIILKINAFSQVTIHFIDSEKVHPDSFYFKIYAPINTQGTLFANPYYLDTIKAYDITNNRSKTTVEYQIKDTSIGFFADLFGKETILIPNDQVNIQIHRRGVRDDSIKINNRFYAYWAYDYIYQGKNKYLYTILDTLTYYTGYVYKYFIKFEPDKYSLNDYYDSVSNIYLSRLKIIHQYTSKYNIPKGIAELVNAECYAAYVINLLIPLQGNDILPEKYASTLKNIDFNYRYLFKTPLYADAYLDYVEKYLVKYLQQTTNPENTFQATYLAIKNAFPNSNTGAILLSRYIMNNEKKHFSCFDSLCNNFKFNYPTASQIHILDSLVERHREKNKITKNDAFSALLLSATMQFSNIQKCLNKKPIIINCWASWCSPCIKEIPILEAKMKEYNDNIDIIYISFDNNKSDWLKKQNELGINQQQSYLLINNFKSAMANYFDITAIPRLILVDADGNIVNEHLPSPNNDAFKNDIDAVLKKNKL